MSLLHSSHVTCGLLYDFLLTHKAFTIPQTSADQASKLVINYEWLILAQTNVQPISLLCYKPLWCNG